MLIKEKETKENKKIGEKLIINSIFEAIEIPDSLNFIFVAILLRLIGNWLLINSRHEFQPVDKLLELNQLFARKRHKH